MTSIGDSAFSSCTNLVLTSLPSNLTSIGRAAFDGCTNLTLTSLPSNLTNIGASAFSNCINLALTSLPSSIINIGDHAFSGCINLALTSLPSNLTSIEQDAFSGCTNLALTSLPSNLTDIGKSAFSNCKSLALTSLPSSIINIGNYAFSDCKALTTLTCDGEITSLGTFAFNGNNMALTRIEFPNMTMNTLYTTFGTPTEANACQQLEVADIGGIKAIAANAFANCHKLQTLVLRRSDAICTLANVSGFLNTPMRGYNNLTGTIYVPSALVETYKTATNWKTLYDAGYITFASIEGSEWEKSE